MKTALIKRLQRAIMTRDIDDEELEVFAEDMESYPLIPTVSNGLKSSCKKVVEQPNYDKVVEPRPGWVGEVNTTSWFQFATSVNNGGQKGEETMDTNYEARNRLNGRLRDAYSEKFGEGRKTFFIDSDPVPKTGQELIDRITSGKYTYDKDTETKILERDGQWCHSYLDFIEWRDPANKPDRVGYDAWVEKLDKAFQNAKDEIIVKDPKDGLETLRAFQALVVN